MKNRGLNTVLRIFKASTICLCFSLLYVVYVPMAFVRIFVDTDSFVDFVKCVGKCVKTLGGWFTKSTE